MSSAAWLTGAFVASGALRVVALGWIARALRPEAFGRFQYLSSVYLYFYAISEFGLVTLGTRRVAQNIEQPFPRIREILSARLGMSTLGLALVLGLADGLAGQDASLLRFLGLGLLIAAGTLDWALRGLGRVRTTAAGEVLRGALFLGLVAALIRGPEDLGLVLGLQLLCGLGLALFLGIALLKARRPAGTSATPEAPASILRTAAPIAAGEITASYFGQCDLVVLHWLSGSATVGLYAPGLRFLSPLIQLVGTVLQAWFPLLAEAHRDSPERFKALLGQILRAATPLCLAGALAGWLLAPWVLRLFFGAAYAEGARPFQILLVSFCVLAWRAPLSSALIAAHKEWLYLRLILVASIVKTLACALLASRFGASGAAWGSLLAELAFAAGSLLAIMWLKGKPS